MGWQGKKKSLQDFLAGFGTFGAVPSDE